MSCSCGGDCCSTPDGVKTLCLCCAGVDLLTPLPIANLPGAAQLRWRVGTHGSFKATLEAGIGRQPALGRLSTRRGEDWTLGLIDAWACALEVLSFYQERYGQELFLRTARERHSLLELARLIGYELAPGVAARVPLAFTLDEGPMSPREVLIPAGTRAQSLPQHKEELPQSFETAADLLADVRFSRLHPRLVADHPSPQSGKEAFWLAGTATGLDVGSPLLWVTSNEPQGQKLLRVHALEIRTRENRTLVRCTADSVEPRVKHDPSPVPQLAPEDISSPFAANSFFRDLASLPRIEQEHVFRWSQDNLAIPPVVESGGPGLYALRVMSRPFGHNAPLYTVLPTTISSSFENWDNSQAPFKIGRSAALKDNKNCIHLEQSFPRIRPGSWLVLEAPGKLGCYLVASATEESVADFAIAGKSSRLELADSKGNPQDHGALDFPLRATTVLTASEKLALAPVPIEEVPAGKATLLLEEVVPQLAPGRLLVAEGELVDKSGQIGRQELWVERVVTVGARTLVYFRPALKHAYRAQTLTLYGNVAVATHGETKSEVLGSGDAARPHQNFRLRQSPLTHVATEGVAGGAAASLEVRVEGVRWQEVPSFYPLGPCDRAYVLRRDEQGRTRVLFGDGRRGARLPTGGENVSAIFRVGIGQAGLVGAGRISLLPNPPLGVRAVTNPLASADAEDPETRDRARDNAPTTVRTLERVVSLSDYQDFARTFAGIDKARADFVWDGERRVIFLTLAGAHGAVPSSALVGRLGAALAQSRDGRPPLRLGSFVGVPCLLVARLLVDQDRRFADVEAAARVALESAFGFERRALGQSLRRAEIVAVLHRVPGVRAVDIDRLEAANLVAVQDPHGLQASPARWDSDQKELRPAQLLHFASPDMGAIQLLPLLP